LNTNGHVQMMLAGQVAKVDLLTLLLAFNFD